MIDGVDDWARGREDCCPLCVAQQLGAVPADLDDETFDAIDTFIDRGSQADAVLGSLVIAEFLKAENR